MNRIIRCQNILILLGIVLFSGVNGFEAYSEEAFKGGSINISSEAVTGENSGYEVPAEALAEKGQAVVIELMDIPELLEKGGAIARTWDAQTSLYREAYSEVDAAYDSIYQDTKDSYDSQIEELRDRLSEAEPDNKAGIRAEINSLNKQKNQELKSIRQDIKKNGDAENSRIRSVERNLYDAKKNAGNKYQGMFFDYKEMELSKSALEQKLLLSAGEYEKTVREAALGGASSAEVQSKKAEMESDENSLESMNVNMEKLKRTIGMGLGYSPEECRNITFGAVPDYSLNYADTRALEADIKSAYQQNTSMGQAYSIHEKDFTSWNHKAITVDKTEKQIQIAMEELLDNVREKQQGLLASETSLQLAAKNQSSADIKLSSGLISRQEYIGLKLNYIDEQNSAEKAKLDYSRAVFDYEQAVTRGVINI